MKTQMKFQKIMCLVMLILGAVATLYAFLYCSGGLSELGYSINPITKTSYFTAADGKYDATLYSDIQSFNTALMYCGIVMILLAVILYITACNKRRNYYISNYVSVGLCAGGDIIMSIVLMALNGSWKAKFLQVDFDAWETFNYDTYIKWGDTTSAHFSNSTLWFDLGFVVYSIIIVASILLILSLVWKIMLMKGEKRLLNGDTTVKGGAIA